MKQFSARFLVTLAFLLNIVFADDTISALDPMYTADAGKLTRRQACIWIPIVFALIIIAAVGALYSIDDPKNRDTILYAKFIANLKEKQA